MSELNVIRLEKDHMTNWLVFAVLSILGLSGYRILIKVVGGETTPFIYIVCASFLYFLAWLIVVLHEGPILAQLEALPATSALLILGLTASFFLADYSLLRAYMIGAPLSIMTVLLGLSMAFTVLFGLFFFRESLNWLQVVGILLGIASFVILSFAEGYRPGV